MSDEAPMWFGGGQRRTKQGETSPALFQKAALVSCNFFHLKAVFLANVWLAVLAVTLVWLCWCEPPPQNPCIAPRALPNDSYNRITTQTATSSNADQKWEHYSHNGMSTLFVKVIAFCIWRCFYVYDVYHPTFVFQDRSAKIHNNDLSRSCDLVDV